ncbi:hypothetical protein BZK31_05540 [Pseudomonas floridensis]|uniref:Uncharacterized protein n=1 Tax=Pseudomonas floridensis TaxID=1958950 RepID=A0A1X0N9Z7_9PSED|nr:hypothetical protein [Pseudomonas floridensis]ORC60734.1 hypothetical protein BZK31_05540 [Pseudomonas floridensis]
MDSTQQSDDDGIIRIQRLVPGQVDVVLGSHPSRKVSPRPRKPRAYGLWLAGLVVVGCLGAMITSHLHKPKAVPLPVAEPPAVEAQTSWIDSESVPTASPSPATLRREAYVLPKTEPASAAASNAPLQPLDNCLKNGNVIDESVLNCRFGQVPRPTQTEPAQGMVSAGYMADFKADAARPAARPSRPYKVATVSIREWDGRNRYRAQWRVYDNTIDGDSVCENFLARSVERRECRKSAQVNFREECREWTKRANRDRDQESRNAEQRYCEAASTFTP